MDLFSNSDFDETLDFLMTVSPPLLTLDLLCSAHLHTHSAAAEPGLLMLTFRACSPAASPPPRVIKILLVPLTHSAVASLSPVVNAASRKAWRT